MSSPVKRGGSLDKWIVRKHGKIKTVIPKSILKKNRKSMLSYSTK